MLAWSLPRSSPTRSPAAEARSARASARRIASSPLPVHEQGVGELDFECEVDLLKGHERDSSLEQVDGSAVVLAEGCTVAGGRQAPPRRA